MSESLTELQRQLNLTKIEINAATKIAAKNAGKWLKKRAVAGLAKATGVPYRTMKNGKRIYFGYNAKKSESRMWFGVNDLSIKHLNSRERNRMVKETSAFTSRKFNGHYLTRIKGSRKLSKNKVVKVIHPAATQYLNKMESEALQVYEQEFLKAIPQVIRPI